MHRSSVVPFVYLILNVFARILLYVVRSFVVLGEFVIMAVVVPTQFIYAHLRALFYVIRYAFSKIWEAILTARKKTAYSVTRLFTRMQVWSKGLSIRMERAKYERQLDIQSFHSTYSWGKEINTSRNLFSRTIRDLEESIRIIRTRIVCAMRNSASVFWKILKYPPTAVRRMISWLQRRVLAFHSHIKNKLPHRLQQPISATACGSRDDIHMRVKRKYQYLRVGIILLLLCIFASSTYGIFIFYTGLPRPQDIGRVNFALSTHIYDRNGKSLYNFYKDEQRTPVRLVDLPPYVATATIAIEDKDFYRHNGISILSGIARAFRDTFFRNQGVQGGSTITQQLVKTALLSPERTLLRKFREAIIALETERVFSKDEILEMYLNQVPYGGSAYGIEEASRKFFGKEAKALSVSEAALLAGLPQAPTNYSPFTNLSSAIYRRDQVLHAMYEQQYISEKEYTLAIREQMKIVPDKVSILAPHFVFYVRKQLEDLFDTNDLYQGGYKVYTTLDLDIQKKAEQILQDELDKIRNLSVGNGAILVVDPLSGEIRAMVGSLNYFDGKSGEYNVTTALRQPGSSIKPVMYSYALERGFTAATIIDDAPTVFQTGGAESYRPVNYDGRFHGKVTLRSALGNSFNIPAVKVMNRIGVEDFISYANHLGIDTWQDPSNYGLSIALGGGDVTMIDMAEAYGVLANGGLLQDISSISEILDKNGRAMKQERNEPEQVVDPAYTYIISDILSDNQARAQAFGYGSQLEIPGYKVAVKTGTTDEKRDNWTIGYTPDYLVLVWVGNNDHTPMNPYLTSGVTGAAPIWNRMMKYLLEEKNGGSQRWYAKPDNVVQKICFGKMESFVVGTENSVPCSLPKPTPKNIADGNPAGNQ